MIATPLAAKIRKKRKIATSQHKPCPKSVVMAWLLAALRPNESVSIGNKCQAKYLKNLDDKAANDYQI